MHSVRLVLENGVFFNTESLVVVLENADLVLVFKWQGGYCMCFPPLTGMGKLWLHQTQKRVKKE